MSTYTTKNFSVNWKNFNPKTGDLICKVISPPELNITDLILESVPDPTGLPYGVVQPGSNPLFIYLASTNSVFTALTPFAVAITYDSSNQVTDVSLLPAVASLAAKGALPLAAASLKTPGEGDRHHPDLHTPFFDPAQLKNLSENDAIIFITEVLQAFHAKFDPHHQHHHHHNHGGGGGGSDEDEDKGVRVPRTPAKSQKENLLSSPKKRPSIRPSAR